MDLEEAKTLLAICKRNELRDHAFGDAEVYWIRDGAEVAYGYFGNGNASVSIFEGSVCFENNDARELRKIGAEGLIDRNDTTGTDIYVEQ